MLVTLKGPYGKELMVNVAHVVMIDEFEGRARLHLTSGQTLLMDIPLAEGCKLFEEAQTCRVPGVEGGS